MAPARKRVLLLILLILAALAPTCGLIPVSAQTPTWTKLPNSFAPAPLNSIAWDPETHALWLSVARVGMEVSADGGQTWSQKNTGLPVLKVNQIGFNTLGDPIVVDSWNPPAGVFRYNGTSWQPASGVSSAHTIAKPTLDRSGAIIEVTGWGADVFRSTDNGNTFSRTASNITHGTGALWCSAAGADGSIYAGGEAPDGVYVSKDNGRTWTPIGPSNAEGYSGNASAMTFNGRGQLLVARDLHSDGASIQRYTGSGWEESCTGIPAYAPVPYLCQGASGALYALVILRGTSPASAIYRSTDGGRTWSQFMDGISGPVVGITADNAGRLWAIVNGPNSGVYTINTGGH